AIEPALTLGGQSQGEYTLLRVVMPIIPVTPETEARRVSGLHPKLLREIEEFHAEQQQKATEYPDQLAAQIRARSLTIHTKVVLQDRVAAAILHEAATINADAIALTTRGQGGLNRLLLGSVAEKLIRG